MKYSLNVHQEKQNFYYIVTKKLLKIHHDNKSIAGLLKKQAYKLSSQTYYLYIKQDFLYNIKQFHFNL